LVVMLQCLGEDPARSGFYADGAPAQDESAGTASPCFAFKTGHPAPRFELFISPQLPQGDDTLE
jgi:hypothetical protein